MDWVTWINSGVGLIGIIVGIIGFKNINDAKKIKNTIYANRGSKIQMANEIHNGLSVTDVVKYTGDTIEQKFKPYEGTFKTLSEIELLIKTDSHYIIPICWSGTQGEYDLLISKNLVHDDIYYYVSPDE